MNSTDKANLYNKSKDEIESLLNAVDTQLGGKCVLDIIASILNDYDLDFLSSLVKASYEPPITNQWLKEECCYDEGNEDMGHISLSIIFDFVKDILNKADPERMLTFGSKYVRLETDEEMEEEGHSRYVDWYKEDEEIDLKKLIGFAVE